MSDLVGQPDVEAALLRPLTTNEAAYIDLVIEQAENALRTRLPSVDDRMGEWAEDPRPISAIDPDAVRRVLAGVIRRKLNNPSGAIATTDSRTAGPYSQTQTVSFATRFAQSIGDGTPGELEITDADLAALVALPSGLPSTIRVRPRQFGEEDLHPGQWGGYPCR